MSTGLNICIPYPKEREAVQQWDYLLSSFPPDRLYLLGEERGARPNRGALVRGEFIGSCEDLPTLPLIAVQPRKAQRIQGELSLRELIHPEEAIYLFGRDTEFLSEEDLGEREPEQYIYIPTATDDDLYSWVAGAIVVWDRELSLG